MRTLRSVVAAMAALGALGPSTPLAAQQAPLVLSLPGSPRAFGFGDAWIGGVGPDAVFSNPAQVGRGNGLTFSWGRVRDHSSQAGFASSTSLGPVHLAGFAQWLDYNAATFPAGPARLTIGGPFSASSLAGGLALAARIKGFRVGGAAKYVEERTPAGQSSGAAYDLGISRDVWRLTIGLTARNLGRDLSIGGVNAELPTSLSVGATSRRIPIGTFFDLTGSAALSRDDGGDLSGAGGLELLYEPVGGWTAAVRVGARSIAEEGSPARRPITIGGSLGLDRFALDYGYEAYQGAGPVHRLAIRIAQ